MRVRVRERVERGEQSLKVKTKCKDVASIALSHTSAISKKKEPASVLSECVLLWCFPFERHFLLLFLRHLLRSLLTEEWVEHAVPMGKAFLCSPLEKESGHTPAMLRQFELSEEGFGENEHSQHSTQTRPAHTISSCCLANRIWLTPGTLQRLLKYEQD